MSFCFAADMAGADDTDTDISLITVGAFGEDFSGIVM